jgi:hypothetical protein
MWINDQAYGPLASHIGPSILLLITIKEARFCSKKIKEARHCAISKSMEVSGLLSKY